MKALFTTVVVIFFVLAGPKAFGQHEADCAKLEFWTSYLPQNPVHPTMPYNAVLVCDTPGTSTPINIWARFGYVGNWDLAELQDGWGYGVFHYVFQPGQYAFDVSCLTPTDTLQPGETLYFRKVAMGATAPPGLGSPSSPFYLCQYWGQIWSYTVPNLTTGVHQNGLPSGIHIRTDGLSVSITADDGVHNFRMFDMSGKLVHQGQTSQSSFRLETPGLYIMQTEHGTRRFFVSD